MRRRTNSAWNIYGATPKRRADWRYSMTTSKAKARLGRQAGEAAEFTVTIPNTADEAYFALAPLYTRRHWDAFVDELAPSHHRRHGPVLALEIAVQLQSRLPVVVDDEKPGNARIRRELVFGDRLVGPPE